MPHPDARIYYASFGIGGQNGIRHSATEVIREIVSVDQHGTAMIQRSKAGNERAALDAANEWFEFNNALYWGFCGSGHRMTFGVGERQRTSGSGGALGWPGC